MLLYAKMVNKSDQHDTSVLQKSNADVTASDPLLLHVRPTSKIDSRVKARVTVTVRVSLRVSLGLG